jgi:stage V sporulation protein R
MGITGFPDHKLPPDTLNLVNNIFALAEGYGLNYHPIKFVLVTPKELNGIAAYDGFPSRMPHWQYGMAFDDIHKRYTYGQSKIYELVINTNPVIAYLLSTNSLVEQKLVMIHVCGHADFFKNNRWFSGTDLQMIDQTANNASRVRRMIDLHGENRVEDFLDICYSLENLVDPYLAHIKRKGVPHHEDDKDPTKQPIFKLKSNDYMDRFINTKDFLDLQKRKQEESKRKSKLFPEDPDRDVLGFLVDHAPLERWQRDILGMVREEANYFSPQRMTKIMNEGWACVKADTLVFSKDSGILTMQELVHQSDGKEIFDGQNCRKVYDKNIIKNHNAVKITTKRGLELTGSNNHRVQLIDGSWCQLDQLKLGDRVTVSSGPGTWPSEEIKIQYKSQERLSYVGVAEKAGVSLTTVMRYLKENVIEKRNEVEDALKNYHEFSNDVRRKAIKIPETMSAKFAAFIGYLIGDGHISEVKRTLGLTTGDLEQAQRFLALTNELFGIDGNLTWDESGGSKRWRVNIYAKNLNDFLINYIGLTFGPSARIKKIPSIIMKSPEHVVRECLRAYFDCDAYGGKAKKNGIILSTSSDFLAEQTQVILLNYGILSSRRKAKDECWQLHIRGLSAQKFSQKIGFNLLRKQQALVGYVENHQWFKKELWVDSIRSVEKVGPIDVYDISVEETHKYAAGGFLNHNSYWHSKAMTTKLADHSEIIDYCDSQSRAIATNGQSLNPYRLGLHLYKDIEDRWNKGKFGPEWDRCEDLVKRHQWDLKLGLGKEKIFQVRKTHNDLTFIDEFLTPEFCAENQLFSFKMNDFSHTEIQREFVKVKDQLLKMLANGGSPVIQVANANHDNKGELKLEHVADSQELDYKKAKATMQSLFKVWTRPVHVETIQLEGETQKKVLWSYDGSTHSSKLL